MLRRFTIGGLLIIGYKYTLWQQQVMLASSVINMMYLLTEYPLKDQYSNRIEIFNELSVLIYLEFTTCFMDAAQPPAFKYWMGWVVIAVSTMNIAVNIMIVVLSTLNDVWKSMRRYWGNRKVRARRLSKYKNWQYLQAEFPGKFEEQRKALEEDEAIRTCAEWIPQRNWLRARKINFDDFPEEIEF